ncbi:MAG: AarF/UbiB family protein, partial [Acidimicrobiia bacterium]
TRLRRLLEEAGGVYVKVGQIAATRADLLPPEMCAELASLQNRVPAEPRHRIEPVLEAELGRPVAEVFAEFEWEPLAAASIGQTHRATLHSGEKVVVKVQRPDIERSMERDLAALAQVAGLAERRTPLGRNIRSGEILAQFAENLLQELDFVGEARSMTEMAVVLDATSGVRVPTAHMELCTRRILVQERFEGVTVADIDDLGGSEPARRALADTLLRSALDQILRVGFFHADPHPGNVFILEDGALGLIDFGAVGRLDPIQREAVVDLMAGLVRGDIGLIRDAIERVADMDEDVPPELLERAIARVLAETLRPGGQTDPKALQQLVLMLAQFGIRLPGDLVLLSRALVTLDGTLGALSPGLTIASAVAEVSASTDGRPVLDEKAMVRDALLTTLPRLRRLPDRIDRIVTLAARGDLRVRSVLDEDGKRILRTLVNRALLAGVGAAFLVVGAVLLGSADTGPVLSGGTSLIDIFGYGGLLIGTVLLLRVVAAVARDGTT